MPDTHDARMQAIDSLVASLPVGTVVTVAPVGPASAGRVRLYVQISPAPVNHITARTALVLGVPYDPDSDTLAGDGQTVARLAFALHGDSGDLCVRYAILPEDLPGSYSGDVEYRRSQLDRLDGGTTWAVKMRSDTGETHWMTVPLSVARLCSAALSDGE